MALERIFSLTECSMYGTVYIPVSVTFSSLGAFKQSVQTAVDFSNF